MFYLKNLLNLLKQILFKEQKYMKKEILECLIFSKGEKNE